MTELVFTNLFLPTLAAFGIGIVGALLCLAAFRPTRSMLLTCAFLPPLVCSCLLAVNGSVGTSIAVLGVFGLVRFRSLPAKGTDMICIIYSMVTGRSVPAGRALRRLLSALAWTFACFWPPGFFRAAASCRFRSLCPNPCQTKQSIRTFFRALEKRCTLKR